jgi:meiotic recombination protein SPO11
MQHENDKLAARRIKWLGLWASELEQYVIRYGWRSFGVVLKAGSRFGIAKDDLLPITKHDEKKVSRALFNLALQWISFTAGIGNASSRKCTYSCKMEVSDDSFNSPFVFVVLNKISVRKEMQYMLHSRRKAEIEVLYTQSKANDNGTGAFGETYPCSNSNPILQSHYWQSYYKFKSKSTSKYH